MRIRTAFLVAALGLVATFTLEQSSQAGSVEIIVTDSIFVENSNFDSNTITKVTLSFFGLSGSPLISNPGGGVGMTSTGPETPNETVSGNQIILTFNSPVSLVTGSVTFETTVPSSDVGMLTGLIKASGVVTTVAGTESSANNTKGGILTNNLSFSSSAVTLTPIPEPTSMALLGIGMTSFLAFRRFFKRNPLA